MTDLGIVNLTATEMVSGIRSKSFSARELMESHLEMIDLVNPKVNAIVTLHADLGIKGADLADKAVAKGDELGVLHGLPTAHKDLVLTKGIRTTFGSPLFANHIPDISSLIVERIQAAGAITIGKTNTPEFGAGSQTFNEVFGATLNPFDISKISVDPLESDIDTFPTDPISFSNCLKTSFALGCDINFKVCFLANFEETRPTWSNLGLDSKN